MIVKKIANPRKSASKRVRIQALAAYIRAPENTSKTEKCAYYGARQFFSDDPAVQALEMVELAEAAVRSPDPITHYVLSWRKGERPSAEQVEQAVDLLLQELDITAADRKRPKAYRPAAHTLEDHQVVYGLHIDTDNVHLHVMFNRAYQDSEDPDRVRVAEINCGFDVEAGHRAGVRIEQAQGWEVEANKRYRIREDDTLERVPQNATVRPRKPTQRQLDTERRTRIPSAARIAIECAGPVIATAKEWGALHAGLRALDMRYLPTGRGDGATLMVGDIPVKASRVDGGASLRMLERRLGPYEPADARAPRPERRTDIARHILDAKSWAQLHHHLARQGWRYERKGSGAVVRAGDVTHKASDIARGATLRALEKTLGPFEAPAREGADRAATDAASGRSQRASDLKGIGALVDAATHWAQFHERIGERGWRYEKTGSGATLTNGIVRMKASAVSRRATLAALERRLGPYEPHPQRAIPPPAGGRVLDAECERHRAAAIERRNDELRVAEEDHAHVVAELERESAKARAARNQALKSAEPKFFATLGAMAERQARERRAAAAQRHRAQRADIHKRHAHLASPSRALGLYTTLIPTQAPPGAPETLPPAHHAIPDHTAVTVGQRVDYLDRNRSVVCSDLGSRVHVARPRDDTALLAALWLASEKWGERFDYPALAPQRAAAVKLAARHGIPCRAFAEEGPCWAHYVAARAPHEDARHAAWRAWEAERDAEAREVAKRQGEERDALCGDRASEAQQRQRRLLAAEHARELAALENKRRRARKAFKARHPPWPDYAAWIDHPALARLWRERTVAHPSLEPGALAGEATEAPSAHDHGGYEGRAVGPWVLYATREQHECGQVAFVDRGRRITLHERDDIEAASRAALQLAAQKWGKVRVGGSQAHKERSARLAAELGITLVNPELQGLIRQYRRDAGRPADATGTREGVAGAPRAPPPPREAPATAQRAHTVRAPSEHGHREKLPPQPPGPPVPVSRGHGASTRPRQPEMSPEARPRSQPPQDRDPEVEAEALAEQPPELDTVYGAEAARVIRALKELAAAAGPVELVFKAVDSDPDAPVPISIRNHVNTELTTVDISLATVARVRAWQAGKTDPTEIRELVLTLERSLRQQRAQAQGITPGRRG